jgi:hypothetical protein
MLAAVAGRSERADRCPSPAPRGWAWVGCSLRGWYGRSRPLGPAWSLLWLALTAGCAAAPAAPHDVFPTTDRDPLPHTPAPQAEGATGGTVALAAAGGEDQARRMVHALLSALRDADARRLDQLLADGVVRLRDTRRALQRAGLVQHVLDVARRGLIPPDADIGTLVDVDDLQVSRAAQFWHGREIPAALQPTDVVVEMRLLQAGRVPLRVSLGWQLRGYVVVRPGPDPRIVAL